MPLKQRKGWTKFEAHGHRKKDWRAVQKEERTGRQCVEIAMEPIIQQIRQELVDASQIQSNLKDGKHLITSVVRSLSRKFSNRSSILVNTKFCPLRLP
jgi:hypothetical protein